LRSNTRRPENPFDIDFDIDFDFDIAFDITFALALAFDHAEAASHEA
jgi:hypothetical protein